MKTKELIEIINKVYNNIEYNERVCDFEIGTETIRCYLDEMSEIIITLNNEFEKNIKERSIKFARYYISNKSIIEFNKDNDETVYNEYLTILKKQYE